MDTMEYLLAKDAIADAAKRYCRGIDRCDADVIKSAFHPDAAVRYAAEGNAWEFAHGAAVSLRRYKATMHAITNQSIDGLDLAAGTATGEIYCTAYHLREAEGSLIVDVWWGRYLDQYSRIAGEWRIQHRVCVHEWTMELPIDSAMPIPAELFQAGSFDRKV